MNHRSTISIGIFVVGIAGALIWRFMLNPPPNPPLPVDSHLTETRSQTTRGRTPSLLSSRRQTTDGTLVRREVVLMGSSFVFVVDAPSEKATAAIDSAVSRLRQLEYQISSWRPDSDISKLNGRAGKEPVQVGDETFELLRLARQLHHHTGGAFDVTIGPVWDLWPFRDSQQAIPSRRSIDQALKLVDASKITLDETRRTAFLPDPGMRVNLGAIGKGYAAKLAVEEFKRHGIARAAISAGGDLFLLGKKTSGPWIVEIEHPRGGSRPLDRFTASDTAVATSGNAKRFIVRDGRRYGHILDPRTGNPVDDCRSVTIITGDPAVADAYATAVFVMGSAKGMAWIENHPDVEGLIVDAGDNVLTSSGWSSVTHRAPPTPLRRNRATATHNDDGTTSVATPSMTRTTPAVPKQPVVDRPADRKEGAMVSIGAGEFLAGEERSPRTLPGYRIDQTEVTNAQYKQFLQATREQPHEFCHPEEPRDKDHKPRYWREFRPPLFRNSVAAELAPFNELTFRHDDHPVVGVDWWDAFAYARWAGKRLPTRDEWERAARGTDGRLWPWGNTWDRKRANGGGEKWGERDGVLYTAPAVSFKEGASPGGCLNMAGNVAEWTEEGFVMGGSFKSNPSQLACFAGQPRQPGYRSFCIGFRCAAAEANPPEAKSPVTAKKEANSEDRTKEKPKDQAKDQTKDKPKGEAKDQKKNGRGDKSETAVDNGKKVGGAP